MVRSEDHLSAVEHFRSHGILKLEGFHGKRRMQPLKARILDELARLGVWRAGKAQRHAVRNLPPFQQIARLSSSLQVPGLHETLVTAEVMDAISRMAGRRPTSVAPTQLLISLPHAGPWTLQQLNWHVDITNSSAGQPPGIQAFFLIDNVAQHGGATLALAGSHRKDLGAPARAALRSRPTHEDLECLGLSVVEMCGASGDLYLMDMCVLHTPSLNTSKHLRLMATSRLLFA